MKLDALYNRLTPDERFRAAISAAARKDGEELDRLKESAPVRQILSHEPGYFGRIKELWLVTMIYSSVYVKRSLCGAMCMLVLLALEDRELDEADGSGEPVTDEAVLNEDPSRADRIAEAAEVSIARARGQARAFNEFCTTLGLIPDEVRRAFGVEDDEFAALLFERFPLTDDFSDLARQAEQRDYEYWHDFFSQFWKQSVVKQYERIETIRAVAR